MEMSVNKCHQSGTGIIFSCALCAVYASASAFLHLILHWFGFRLRFKGLVSLMEEV